MLASAAGALFAMLYVWFTTGSPIRACAATACWPGSSPSPAPCAFVTPIGAFIIGVVSGPLVVISCNFFDRIKIDDPVGAISVHGTNGAWGLISVGLFSDGSYGQGWSGVGATDYLGKPGFGVAGLFYGDSKQLLAQLIEVVVCIAWNVVVGGVIFYIVGKLVGNRVPAEVEIAGLDIPEMGVPGYPEYIDVTLPSDVPASEVAEAKKAIPALA